MKYLLVVLVLVWGQAQAGEWRANVNVASHHFVEPPAGMERWNERNYGAGVEWHAEDYFVTAGRYDNSFRDTTAYLGAGKEWRVGEYIHVGAEAALATGYSEHAEYINVLSAGDLTLIGDLYVSVGRQHRLKLLTAGQYAGVQYQVGF